MLKLNTMSAYKQEYDWWIIFGQPPGSDTAQLASLIQCVSPSKGHAGSQVLFLQLQVHQLSQKKIYYIKPFFSNHNLLITSTTTYRYILYSVFLGINLFYYPKITPFANTNQYDLQKTAKQVMRLTT